MAQIDFGQWAPVERGELYNWEKHYKEKRANELARQIAEQNLEQEKMITSLLSQGLAGWKGPGGLPVDVGEFQGRPVAVGAMGQVPISKIQYQKDPIMSALAKAAITKKVAGVAELPSEAGAREFAQSKILKEMELGKTEKILEAQDVRLQKTLAGAEARSTAQQLASEKRTLLSKIESDRAALERTMLSSTLEVAKLLADPTTLPQKKADLLAQHEKYQDLYQLEKERLEGARKKTLGEKVKPKEIISLEELNPVLDMLNSLSPEVQRRIRGKYGL